MHEIWIKLHADVARGPHVERLRPLQSRFPALRLPMYPGCTSAAVPLDAGAEPLQEVAAGVPAHAPQREVRGAGAEPTTALGLRGEHRDGALIPQPRRRPRRGDAARGVLGVEVPPQPAPEIRAAALAPSGEPKEATAAWIATGARSGSLPRRPPLASTVPPRYARSMTLAGETAIVPGQGQIKRWLDAE